jgi:hypothetical protein
VQSLKQGGVSANPNSATKPRAVIGCQKTRPRRRERFCREF